MMSTDPIADLLTRIRNAQKAKLDHVQVPYSQIKDEISQIIKAEGFIQGATRKRQGKWEILELALRYEPSGQPLIKKIVRVSRPGRRVYFSKQDLVDHKDVITTKIVTTPKGVMTDRQAFEQGLGGEVICQIS